MQLPWNDPEVIKLANAIKKNGCDPLAATIDNYIVSGHRRHVALIRNGQTAVSCRVLPVRRDSVTTDEYVALLRAFNHQRHKSAAEQVREELVDIDPAEAHRKLRDLRDKRGFCSIDPWHDLYERYRASGKKRLIVIVLSDFDPEGEMIPQVGGRTLRGDFGVEDFDIIKAGVTRAQIDNYALPSQNFAKETSSNHQWFVGRNGGDDAVYELEALEPENMLGDLEVLLGMLDGLGVARLDALGARQRSDTLESAVKNSASLLSIYAGHCLHSAVRRAAELLAAGHQGPGRECVVPGHFQEGGVAKIQNAGGWLAMVRLALLKDQGHPLRQAIPEAYVWSLQDVAVLGPVSLTI